ncbi:hypothetical protein HPB50_003718 [Hyalomma asiaticum]|uniref:Uncharacterized protein n=1 Tax=Hyalomma asiaticum TaxID=266040 RepID=A0ACB7SVC1_HYAAI|nr:hypothetical protein HPB50_003718 [Hyalomma asiaticum]
MRNRVDCRWDVVVVAMLTTLFAVATNRTMGWFFVAYMDEFGLGRQTASWPGFVILGCHRVSGLLVGMLHKHLSLFLIGLLGSFFAWGGITVSAFAPSIAWMSFTTGFVHGMGSGIVIQAHTVVVLQHFSKYRASFIVAVLGSTLLDYVNVVHLFTMVDYARDKGVSYTHAVMALTFLPGLHWIL